MSSTDLISMALRNLFKRKLRTFLTVLGVVIGTASIVVMVSLGIGMNENFQTMIDRMGNITVIYVESNAYYNTMAPKGTPIIDDAALTEFIKIDGVQALTPVVRGDFQIGYGKYRSWGNIMGIDMSLFDDLGYKLESGTAPSGSDKLAIVMGGSVPQNFYNPRARGYSTPPEINPLETTFDLYISTMQDENRKYIIKPLKVTVTGLTSISGYSAYDSFMDLDTVKNLNAERKKAEDKYYRSIGQKPQPDSQKGKGYAQALVKCKDMDTVVVVQDRLKEMGYQAYSQGEWINNMKKMAGSLQGLLGAIGAVSLLVAAIGITNTMLMSIYERTKEIGVMKVIGATLQDIRRLFLVEAAIIGFMGGVAGIGLSFLMSYALNNSGGLAFLDMVSWDPSQANGNMSIIPTWLCLAALGFSTAVGVISGYFPARRAMRLSALAAIRTE